MTAITRCDASTRTTGEFASRLAAAVDALELVDAAGTAELYRADELLVRVRQIAAKARRALADANARLADGYREPPQIPTTSPAPGVRGAPPVVLFWRRVNKTESCWLWTGGVDKDGYGKFQITISNVAPKQLHVRAHRYSFLLEHGRWPDEVSLHSCHNPRCVNPAHINDGTQSQNVVDTVLRRTHHTVRATPEQVKDWRRRAADGEPTTEIAREAGFSVAAVGHAVTRRSWRHVP